MDVAQRLRDRAKTYDDDAFALRHKFFPDEFDDGLTTEQWALVYEIAADELRQVAKEIQGA